MEIEHEIYEIKELSESKRHSDWMIKSLGQLSINPSLQTEIKVDVLMRPVALSIDSRKSYKENKPIEAVVSIGVGQLPILRKGSIWRDGSILWDEFYVYAKENKYRISNIDKDTWSVITAETKDQLGNLIIPEGRWGLPDGFRKSNFIHLKSVANETPPLELVIPAMVLNQAYFCHSSKLSRALFNGDLADNIDSLVNEDRSNMADILELSDDEIDDVLENLRHRNSEDDVQKEDLDGLFIVHARKNLDDQEGPVFARILSDDLARAACMSVHNSIVANRANRQEVHPKGWFPFSGESEITVMDYKLIDTVDVHRRLVLTIDLCSFPVSFNNCLVRRDNDGNKADEETDIPDEQKTEAWTKNTPRSSSEKKALQSESDSDSGLKTENLDIPVISAVGLNKVKILKEKKAQSEYKAAGITTTNIPVARLGTSSGLYNNSKIGRANVSGNIDDESCAQKFRKAQAMKVNFPNFRRVIQHVDSTDLFSASLRNGTIGMGLFGAKQGSTGPKDWAFITPGERTLRRFMVADIVYMDKMFTLIDIERGSADRSGSPIELIRERNYGHLSDERLMLLLEKLSLSLGVMGNINSMPIGIFRVDRWGKKCRTEVGADNEKRRIYEMGSIFGLKHSSSDPYLVATRIATYIASHVERYC